MRVPASLLMLIAMLPAGLGQAQVALPGVPLPDVGRVVPPLPSLDIDPLVTKAGTLAQRRLDRIAGLLRDQRDRVEADRNGEPALRGVLVATGVDAAMIALAADKGFAVIDRERIEGLDLELVRFAVPEGRGLARAQKQLAQLLPGAAIDADHLYFASGAAASVGALPAVALAVAGAPGAAPLGLIDGGVAAHPSVAGRVEQRGFARGAPMASRHGTAVASLLVGSGSVRGAAPGQRLRAADVYGSDPAGGNASAIVRGLGWLAEGGVAVTVISLVGPDNALLRTAVSRAQQRGVLIVAAVGNDGPAAPPVYPAAYPGVLGVTAVDAKGRALPEAGRKTPVDFAAPGDGVLAATGAAKAERLRGTSFAAPLVAGRLARLYPAPVVGRIEGAVTALVGEARDLGKKGRDAIYGEGLICADCGR